MKQIISVFLALIFCSLISNAQITVTSGNETLYIDLGGITNLTQINDPQGNPTNTYSYRRSSLNLDMTINPHITIVGGTCVPNGYYAGDFHLSTSLVVGFYEDNLNNYRPAVTPPCDELHKHNASGTTGFSGQIDFSRHYKSQHSLAIQIDCIMLDYSPCPTPSNVQITFYLYPEATIQEFMWTAQANEAGSDKEFWKQGNCNICNKKGVPGFSVSTVSLMPGFFRSGLRILIPGT